MLMRVLLGESVGWNSDISWLRAGEFRKSGISLMRGEISGVVRIGWFLGGERG